MMPGQLGPISLLSELASAVRTRIMSCTGTPSVMQMISGTSAAMFSRIASAAPGAGT